MLFGVISIIFSIALFIMLLRTSNSFGETILSTIIGVIPISLVGLVLSALLAGVTTEALIGHSPATYTVTQEIPLIALSDSNGYYLSRYNYRSTQRYSYLYNSTDGITSYSVLAKDSFLHFTKEQPTLQIREYTFDSSVLNLFCIPYDQYHFYIPEDSVKIEYLIDLK